MKKISILRGQYIRHRETILLTISLVLFCQGVVLAKYGGGSGTGVDPYLILSSEHIVQIGNNSADWGKHFKLMLDVDMSAVPSSSVIPIGYYDTALPENSIPFTGTFNGNGRKISNLNIVSTGKNNVGLFGFVDGDSAKIFNLGVKNSVVDGGSGSNVGMIAGWVSGGVVSCCYVDGGSVTGTKMVGGLIGNNEGAVYDCYSNAAVLGKDYFVGGLIGQNNAGLIINSYSLGSVLGNKSFIGGLAGRNMGEVVNCYSAGSVSSTLGTAISVGGLIGYCIDSNSVTASFWDVQTSGQPASGAGVGKTTAQMKDINTFLNAGWPFWGDGYLGPNFNWAKPDAAGYPVLCWQVPSIPQVPDFTAGDGSIGNPFMISTPGQLNSIGHNVKLTLAHYKLLNDIDMGPISQFFIIGDSYYPFRGTFDAAGFKISNLTINYIEAAIDPDGNDVPEDFGLFGAVTGSSAEVKNLSMNTPHISAVSGNNVGAIVGRLDGGSISACSVEGGSVSGHDNVGAIAGWNKGWINNSYAICPVTAHANAGGLAGVNYNGDSSQSTSIPGVNRCYSAGTVQADANDWGLVGLNLGWVGNSFLDNQASGQHVQNANGGLERTTAQMRTKVNYTASPYKWDFTGETTNGTADIWIIVEGVDYPRLNRTAVKYGGGAGTVDQPYLIYTPQQLNMIGVNTGDYGKYFKLMSNIDMSELPGGTLYNVIGSVALPFTGKLDGNCKTISNLTCSAGGVNAVGLFGCISGGEVKNLGLINANISAADEVGVLAGRVVNGTLRYCFAQKGSVSGSGKAGGLAGTSQNSTIDNSYSTASVTGSMAGGLIGTVSTGTVSKTYAAGKVNGAGGGLIGSGSATVTASMWDMDTSGQGSSAGGTGKSTSQMKLAATYLTAGWDFVGETANGLEDIWKIGEGRSYARLQWEYIAGDLDGDGDVDGGDFMIFAESWLATPTSGNWNPRCNLIADGIVNLIDFSVLADNWLLWPAKPTGEVRIGLFSEDFEGGAGALAADGWVVQNANATVITAAKYSGAYGARLFIATWIEKTINTTGCRDIHVKYMRKTNALDAGENLYVEWSADNGVNWNNLETVQVAAYDSLMDKVCTAAADNISALKVRFRTNANASGEYAYLDDIEITALYRLP